MLTAFLILLSFFFGECRADNTCDRSIHYTDTVVLCADKAAILPVRTTTYSGDDSSPAPSLRSSNSGRRVQPSFRSAFRLVKAGKVFDRNNFHTFRSVILQFQSGIHAKSRYIYSICQLLI